jgi:hypothetical protein
MRPTTASCKAAVFFLSRRADALGRLAKVALTKDLDAGTAGDRYQVILHVDATATVAADVPSFDGALEVDDAAVHISAETSKRLACEAGVVHMEHDAGGATCLANLVRCAGATIA